jgi:hypothetical protein
MWRFWQLLSLARRRAAPGLENGISRNRRGSRTRSTGAPGAAPSAALLDVNPDRSARDWCGQGWMDSHGTPDRSACGPCAADHGQRVKAAPGGRAGRQRAVPARHEETLAYTNRGAAGPWYSIAGGDGGDCHAARLGAA